jgi:hypothetical protein
MDELLTNAFNTGDIKIVIAALIVYVIVYLQRRDTKSKRDEDRDNLDKRVSLIENEIQEIKNLDLASKLAQIQTDLSWIKEKLK